MTKLDALQAVLLEQLPTIPQVRAYAEAPFPDDTSRRHVIPNEVRVHVAREQNELRLSFSGFIIAIHPDAQGKMETSIDEWVARSFPHNSPMIMPPLWHKDATGEIKEFESMITRHGYNVLAVSTVDGGLGSITIHESTRPIINLEDYMLWHPPVMKICHVTADEIERVLGITEHSPSPQP